MLNKVLVFQSVKQKKADFDTQNTDGYTPFLYAASHRGLKSLSNDVYKNNLLHYAFTYCNA